MSNNSSVTCQDNQLTDGYYSPPPQEEDQSVMVASFVISSLLLVYFIVSLPLFYYYQKKLKHLRVRSFGLLCASTLGMIMIIAVSSFALGIGSNRFPCDALYLFSYVGIPLASAPTLIQLFTFYQRSRLAKAALNLDISKVQAVEGGKNSKHSSVSLRAMMLSNSLKSLPSLNSAPSKSNMKDGSKSSKIDIIEEKNEEDEENVIAVQTEGNMDLGLPERVESFRQKISVDKTNPSPSLTSPQVSSHNMTMATLQLDHQQKQPDQPHVDSLLKLFSIAASTAFTVFLQLTFILPFFIVSLIRIGLSPYGFNNCRGCAFSIEDYIYFAITCLLVSMPMAFSVYKLNSHPDPFGVVAQGKNVLLSCTIPFIIGVSDVLIRQSGKRSPFHLGLLISLTMALIFHVQVTWPLIQAIWNLEKTGQRRGAKTDKGFVVVLDVDNKAEPEEIAVSRPKSVRIGLSRGLSSRKSVVSTKDGFARVFENPVLFEAFEQHITSEFGVESLRFWLETRKWRDSYYIQSEEERRKLANQLISVFIGPNALLPVNIPEKMVVTIYAKVGDVSKDLEIDLFDAARVDAAGANLTKYLIGVHTEDS